MPTVSLPTYTMNFAHMTGWAINTTMNLEFRNTRRLSRGSQHRIETIRFCQPVDIYAISGKKVEMVENGLHGYFKHSLETAKLEIEWLLNSGISDFCIRIHKFGLSDPYEILIMHREVIQILRRTFGSSIQMMVDPFNTALTPRNQWGIETKPGNCIIDQNQTHQFISNLARVYSDAGANSLLTIGRIHGEVGTIKKTLNDISSPMTIQSCSTNSETLTAYIATTTKDPELADTGQKVLCGNVNEMVLRALIDIQEGSDEILQKPTEAYHVLYAISKAVSSESGLKGFLEEEQTKELLAANDFLHDFPDQIKKTLSARGYNIPLGSYTVSGTYAYFKQLEVKYGAEFTFLLFEEFLQNAVSSGMGRYKTLADRMVSWYVQQLQKSKVRSCSIENSVIQLNN